MLRWRRAGEVYMKRPHCLKETENKSLTRGGTIGRGDTGNTRANQNWRTDKERGEDWSADRKLNRKYQTHNFWVSFGSLKAELPIILSPSQSFSTGCGWGDVRAGQSYSFFYGHGFIHEKMNSIFLWLYSLYLAFPCEIFASDVDVGLSTHFWPHSVLLLALRKHNLCLFAFKLYNTSTAHICLNVRLQL